MTQVAAWKRQAGIARQGGETHPPRHDSRPCYRLNSYAHIFTVVARFSDSMLPQPAIV